MRKAALLADWFVDSINGNDANTGRNPSQAFQTIGQLESVLAAGETVGFARDSHWREQWDVAIDNVTAIAYGEGERPLFDASDLISPGDWSKTGGLVNVYECTKTPEWGSTNWVNVFEDNAFLIRVADTATCDATPGSCVPSGGGPGAITIYVHTSGSNDPATNGSTYEYTHRRWGIYENIANSGISLTGLQARRSLEKDGPINLQGINSFMDDCLSEQGNQHGILVRPGSTVQNCISRNGYYGEGGSIDLFLCHGPLGTSGETIFDSCVAFYDDTQAINAKNNGFYCHGDGDYGVTLQDCVGTDLYAFANGGVSSGREYQINDGIHTSDYSGAICCQLSGVGDIIVSGCTFTTTQGGRVFGIVNNNLTVTIRNTTVEFTCPSSAEILWTNNTSLTILIEDCDFGAGAGSFLARGLSMAVASNSLTANRNTWRSNITHYYLFTTMPGTFVSDYNIFCESNTDMWIGATNYATVAAYIAAEPYDQNSTIGGC